MRYNTSGLSRLGRVVAVISMSFTLMIVTTVPSHAVDDRARLYLPESVAPVGIGLVFTSPTIDVGVLESIPPTPDEPRDKCNKSDGCGLRAFFSKLFGQKSGIIKWVSSQFGNSDAIATPTLTFVSQPTITGGYANWAVNIPTPYPNGMGTGSDSIQGCFVTSDYSINCNYYPLSANQTRFPLTGYQSMVMGNTTAATACGFIVKIKLNNVLTTAASANFVGRENCTTPVTLPVAPTTINETKVPNPPRRVQVTKTCIIPAGTTYTVNWTSSNYTRTGTTPNLTIPECTNVNHKTTGVAAKESTMNKDGTWEPSAITNIGLPTQGTIFDYQVPSSAYAPEAPYRDLFLTEFTAGMDIVKDNGNGYISCTNTDCSTYTTTMAQVDNGTITQAQSGYKCTLGGYDIPMSECRYIATGLTAAPNANVDYSTIDECGFSVTCYVEALFTPTEYAAEARINSITVALNSSALGIVPQAISDFATPLMSNTVIPNQENCSGPTLTLPKNMGVTGTQVAGDYVIQPLYACNDTAAGRFGAQISGIIRSILLPTIYVTGAYMIINTLLAASGMSLPMFGRRDETP